ncbi:hypothetical protein [Haloplanus natans]|uniref:hypothetical protein n=1 Tax=Haloplanus natans TaxID=376171 RepID=UPI00067802AE|nr:hypothetical protein [Haloplanus natans]
MADGPTIPDWILDLRPLVPLVNTLITIATNPQRWIRNNLGEFVVREVFDLAGYLIGLVLEAVSIVTGQISLAVDSLLEGLGPVGEALRTVPGLIYDPVYEIAVSGGLGAPIASAIAAVIAGSIAVGVIYVLVYAGISVIPGADGVRDGIGSWLN